MFCRKSVSLRSLPMLDKKVKGAVFCVPPLKELVTTKVIRERMDYGNYLGGKVKEELDSFDRLTGKYRLDEDELEVLSEGKKVSEEEWKAMKLRLPKQLISLLDGKEVIKITEKTDSKRREWELQDVDGTLKRLNLLTLVMERKGRGAGTYLSVQYIEDDELVTQHDWFDLNGQLECHMEDSIAIDDEGIIRSRSG